MVKCVTIPLSRGECGMHIAANVLLYSAKQPILGLVVSIAPVAIPFLNCSNVFPIAQSVDPANRKSFLKFDLH